MAYLHYDIIKKQTSKKNGEPCGDVIDYYRRNDSLFIVLADGLGSGVKANISACLCASSIIGLLKNGASQQETFNSMSKRMNVLWGVGHPFSVFAIAKILNNGEVRVLSYDIPPPLYIGRFSTTVMKDEVYTLGKAICTESHFALKEDNSLMMFSDGITQAGLGCGLAHGWTEEGVALYLTDKQMTEELTPSEMAESVHDYARRLWRKANGDDCSVVMVNMRRGISVNVISGTPTDRTMDHEVNATFMSQEGIKVACGGTTSKVLARELKSPLELVSESHDFNSFPKYEIDGVSLVTEGIVTLNQVYNILDEDTTELEEESAVYELNNLFSNADKVTFTIGHAENQGSAHIQFRQQGILPRKTIVPLIIEKLKEAGKLVVVKDYK